MNILYQVIPTNWRSYLDYRFYDVISPCIFPAVSIVRLIAGQHTPHPGPSFVRSSDLEASLQIALRVTCACLRGNTAGLLWVFGRELQGRMGQTDGRTNGRMQRVMRSAKPRRNNCRMQPASRAGPSSTVLVTFAEGSQRMGDRGSTKAPFISIPQSRTALTSCDPVQA